MTKMNIYFVEKPLISSEDLKKCKKYIVQKKSLLKGGLRVLYLNETNELRNEKWYQEYLDNERIEFFIEGSGIYKLMNVDLNEGEFYFEKSNTPVYREKNLFVDMPFNAEFKNGILKELKNNIRSVNVCTIEDLTKSKGAVKLDTEILKEIRNCLLFIADISIIADKDIEGQSKWISNSNVMLELGYALAVKSQENIFITYNDDIAPKALKNSIPFDIQSYQYKKYKKDNYNDLIKMINSRLKKLGF